MTHIVKKSLRMALTFILVFTILFQSLYFKPEKVQANPSAMAIAGYVMSIVGAIDMGTGGGVRGIGQSLRDSLAQKVSDLLGSGIYTDSNGNYVFSGTATQQLYQTLLGSNAYNAIPVSNFPISPNFESPNVTYNVSAWSDVNSTFRSYSSYLLLYGQANGANVDLTLVDTSNVAYFVISKYQGSGYNRIGINFYSKNGSNVSTTCTRYKIYGTSNGQYNKSSGTNNGCTLYSNRYSEYTNYSSCYNNVINDYVSSDLVALQGFNYGCVWSKKTMILCTNASSGASYINKNTGVTVNNVYNQIPSVKSTVIENNNWENIYSNYVQNIQNNTETYINNDTGQIDVSELRKVMERYGQQLYDAVEQGVENIIEYVSVTNEWLDRIYQLLSEINQKLDDGGGSSGGGTVSGSTVDLSTIESYLQSLNTSISAMQTQLTYIANNLPNDEQKLQQIYTVLTNIYNSLQNLPSGGVNNPNSDPYAPWYPKFFGIPDTDILDTINQIEIIETLLSGLVPLCYITGLGAVVNALSAEPVEPDFTIPVEFSNSFYTVDEDIEIDLTMYDDMRDVITGGIILVFMLSLGYFTIWLLKFLLDIMSKT